MKASISAIPLILASSSPRRSEILDMLGIEHLVFKPDIHESDLPLEPVPLVRYLSKRKAEASIDEIDCELILSADTVVAIGDIVLGKPGSEEEGREMLEELSGKWHHVHTGLTLMVPGRDRSITGDEFTAVKFRDLSGVEISNYISTGEPFDKAGAYGIQGKGSTLVERIEGCYFNVVGLPVVRLLTLLREIGYEYSCTGLRRLA